MTLVDDNFHSPESDEWWEHETVWFWFFHPERKVGCWSYHYVLPNLGVAGGGVCDAEGRVLHADGEAVSRMAFPISGVHGVCWQSLVQWSINGIDAWGDDQARVAVAAVVGVPAHATRTPRRPGRPGGRRVDLSRSLEGRVALVTGAGRGIGRAHAGLLAERGASVVVCDLGADLDGVGRDASVAHTVADEIVARGGIAHADESDVSTFAGGARAVDVALDAFGRLDIVVNNAGLAVGGSIEDLTEDELDRVFAVNFVGTVATAHAAWPALVDSGHGRIVNTVSEVAFDPRSSDGRVAYGAAKAAVWSLTLTLAEAGRPHGITVNAVSPGAFTRMNEAMFCAQGRPPGLDLDPVYVARVVGWLVSDAAADVTGGVVHVAGGHHREYLIRREAGTDLVVQLEEALGASRPTASP